MNRRSGLALALAVLAAAPIGCAKRAATTQAPTTAVSETARSQFDHGVELMNAGAESYEEALKAFHAAVATAPDLWEAHLNIGLLELRRRRLGAAAQALQRSIEVFPSPEALDALGAVFLAQGRPEQAAALYERALARDSSSIELRNRLAVALRHTGRLDEAEAELRAILGRDAANVEAYATLAAVHLDRGQLDMAELVIRKGLDRRPDDPRLLTNLGLCALKRGDDQTAFSLFEKASAKDPQFLTGRLAKAAVFLGVADHKRATEELEFVLRVEPGNTDALVGLGVAERMAGRIDDARQTWGRVLALDPDHAAAHYNLGVLAMDFADDPKAARTHLERYLQLAEVSEGDQPPKVKAAHKRLELLAALSKHDKPDKAEPSEPRAEKQAK